MRDVMRAAVPPAVEDRFAGRVVARLAASPAPRGVAGARWFLLLGGGFVTAASVSILAPLLDPVVLRNLALGGALVSPLILMRGWRRTVTRLLGAP